MLGRGVLFQRFRWPSPCPALVLLAICFLCQSRGSCTSSPAPFPSWDEQQRTVFSKEICLRKIPFTRRAGILTPCGSLLRPRLLTAQGGIFRLPGRGQFSPARPDPRPPCLFLSAWPGCSALKAGLACLGRGAELLAAPLQVSDLGRRRGRRIREASGDSQASPVGATRVGLHYGSHHLSP